MAITLEWKFPAVTGYPDNDPGTDFVYEIHWRIIGSDGKYTAEVYGSSKILKRAEEPFMPITQFTVAMARDLVMAANDKDWLSAVNDTLSQRIQDQYPVVNTTIAPAWGQ